MTKHAGNGVAAAGAIFVLGLAACSPSSGGSGPATQGDGGCPAPVACQTQGFPVDTYCPGMKKAGTEADAATGGFTFEIVKTDPAPPAEGTGAAGTNTWTIRVLDASGQPVKGAVVSLPKSASPYGVNPWMPVHMHGSSVLPTVTNNADGTATLVMNFFMPGLWRVFIQAQAGTTTDGALFAFCT